MENQGFSLLKNLISEQLTNSAKDRARIKRRIQTQRLVTYLLLAVVCGVGVIFFTVDENGLLTNDGLLAAAYVIIFIFSTLYFDRRKGGLAAKNSQLWQDYYKKNKNVYVYLREYFFPTLQIETNQETKKHALVANSFLLSNYSQLISYLGQVNDVKTQLTYITKNCFLIGIFLDKTLEINNLYLQTKQVPANAEAPKLPIQTFNYFPEIEKHFDVYTEQKVKAAQFLQANEDLFLQLTKFTKFNLAIDFNKNQIICMIEDIYPFLFLDAEGDVNPADKEVDEYIIQLQALNNFINLLQQIR